MLGPLQVCHVSREKETGEGPFTLLVQKGYFHSRFSGWDWSCDPSPQQGTEKRRALCCDREAEADTGECQQWPPHSQRYRSVGRYLWVGNMRKTLKICPESTLRACVSWPCSPAPPSTTHCFDISQECQTQTQEGKRECALISRLHSSNYAPAFLCQRHEHKSELSKEL